MPTRHESNPYILIWVTVTAFEIWKAQRFLLPFVEAKLNNCCWPSLYKNTQPVCCGRTLGTHHPDRYPRRESARNPCSPTTHTHTHSHTHKHTHTHTHTHTHRLTHTHTSSTLHAINSVSITTAQSNYYISVCFHLNILDWHITS